MNKVVIVCGLVIAAFATAACNPADPVANQPSGAEKVATFDGGEVTQSDLQEAIASFSQQSGMGEVSPGTPEYQAAAQQVLPQLVQIEIAKAYARENGIEVSDQDVDDEIANLKEQLAGQAQAAGQNLPPDEAYKQALEQAGVSEDQLRQDIREQLPIQKVQERVAGDVKPTDEEVQNFYDENKDSQFTTPEQRCARHILFGPDQKEQADDTMQELDDGADFAKLASERSQDTGSAEQGGDLGCIGKGETVPNFEEALFGADEGETVGPVETQFGYHIIRVYDIKPEQVQPLSEVEGQIRAQLTTEKQSAEFTKWLQQQEEKRNVKYLSGYGPNAGQETTQSGQ